MLDDHLEDEKYSNPDGKYSNPSQTNSIAERNFGILDMFTRETPDANMITDELIIMKRTNKTPEWRKKLTLEKRFLMIK